MNEDTATTVETGCSTNNGVCWSFRLIQLLTFIFQWGGSMNECLQENNGYGNTTVYSKDSIQGHVTVSL